jgi:hypothetical protein
VILGKDDVVVAGAWWRQPVGLGEDVGEGVEELVQQCGAGGGRV